MVSISDLGTIIAYRKEWMRILIAALLIMFTQVQIEAKDISRPAKTFGGTLIWGTHTSPTIINPILTTQSVSMPLLEIIFNSLVRFNTKGEIEPDLAQSWDVSADGLVYTFHLRKGVKFHDGVECTANDVKFTFDKIIDPQVNSPFQSQFQLVDSFKAIDKYTFQIVLEKPSSSFIYRLVREIVPKHLLENADLKNCPFNFHPIGTGPFRFKAWTKDNRIILEYNPIYYEGRPYLDRIMVKTYPNSRDVWIALMRSEVDLVLFIEKEDYDIVKDDSSFKAYAVPFDNYYALVYNLDDSVLADKRVIEAIAYGVDRKSLIERVASGHGLECSGPFYPTSLGYNPNVKPFAHNPEKALSLLDQAGWQDKDNDGILEKNAEELEIRVLVDARNEIYRKIIMVLRQQLQAIGIKIKVVLYDNDNLLTPEFLSNNQAQAWLKLFFAAIDPDQTREDWSSREPKVTDKLWVFKNAEVDRLFESGEATQDKTERRKFYQTMHKLIYEDQPACFLYFPFVFHAISSKFCNTDDFFTVSMPHYTMKDWFVNQKIREERR